MALMTWNESYRVKVEKCDEDHQELFSLFNALDDAIKAGEGAQVIQTTVSALLDYTRFHFSREESLLEKTNYPDLGLHRAQHREFVEKVEQFRRDVEAHKIVAPGAVMDFLSNWLTNHIKGTDRRYSAHLNANGVR